MNLKTDTEINELIKYTRWYGGFKSDKSAMNWLNQAIPNWLEVHDTKITYSERTGKDN